MYIMYIYIYIFIHTYIYVCIYILYIYINKPNFSPDIILSNIISIIWNKIICIFSHENNLSQQWLLSNVETHALGHMSCHRAIVVITGRVHCFHDCIYVMLIMLL